MGVKQADMVRHKLFRYTLEEVRQRHCFLERRGLYQTPDKNGQTFIENPKLSQVLHSDLETYLAQIARATAEEYDIFGKITEREWQDEERRERDMGADGADEGYDDDEDEDDGEQGDEVEADKSSYYKRKKRS